MLRFGGQCNGQSADATPYSAGSARNHRRSGRLYAPWESSGGALLTAMCTRDVASSPMGACSTWRGPGVKLTQIPGPVPPGANPTDKTPAEWGLNALRIKAHKAPILGTRKRHPFPPHATVLPRAKWTARWESAVSLSHWLWRGPEATEEGMRATGAKPTTSRRSNPLH
jgi:hypothetical protein